MPIYEYRCQECGRELERLQKLSDPMLTDCPACGKPALKRLVSAAGFRLKGGGWYETDFKSGNRRNVDGGGEAAPETSSGGDNAGETGSSKSSGDSAGKTSGSTPT